jgi:hypothetical protein
MATWLLNIGATPIQGLIAPNAVPNDVSKVNAGA